MVFRHIHRCHTIIFKQENSIEEQVSFENLYLQIFAFMPKLVEHNISQIYSTMGIIDYF